MDPRVDEIASALRGSRKYATLTASALQRIAAWALQRHPTTRAALQAARSKLHQAYGAYLTPGNLTAVERMVAALPMPAARDAVVEASRAVLARHASSAERLGFLSDLYPRLLGPPLDLPHVRRILDLACGLHPLALPWMGLSPETEYCAYDIDERLMRAVGQFLMKVGQTGRAEARDLMAWPVTPALPAADVVLLLKTVPCFERQERGASLRLLQSLEAPCVIVSFPARSLGGREKGMREQYEELALDLARGLRARMEPVAIPTETFYRLWR
jgi:16S rRNA (guanine(1405)-N(7))-methyltransferase